MNTIYVNNTNKLTKTGFLGYNITIPKRSADKSDNEARNVQKATCGRGGGTGRTHSPPYQQRR